MNDLEVDGNFWCAIILANSLRFFFAIFPEAVYGIFSRNCTPPDNFILSDSLDSTNSMISSSVTFEN